METPTKEQLTHELCVTLFGERSTNALRGYEPYMDISRPNFHDSKKEFLVELETVEAVIAHCDGIFNRLVQDGEAASDEHKAMVGRVSDAINGYSHQSIVRKKNLSTASDLALRNIIDSGFYINSIVVMFCMSDAYKRRLIELKQQEADFWNLSHRPPNYYARTIALRFARLFARQREIKPTFGTTSDSSFPSTDYGRALEEVFSILGIKASVRKAAEWALNQLDETDWTPVENSLWDFTEKNDSVNSQSVVEILSKMKN